MDRFDELFLKEMQNQAITRYDQGETIKQIEQYLSNAGCTVREIVDIIEVLKARQP